MAAQELPRLPDEVAPEALAAIVATSRSWRGVLRELGLTSTHKGRQMRAFCDAAGIDYSHSRQRTYDDDRLRCAVAMARSWDELLEMLGLATTSGSARGSVRKRCAQLGLDLRGLEPDLLPGRPVPVPCSHRLREAGALLVAATYVMSGSSVCWPLEPTTYDLLVTHPGASAERVQVKTTTYRTGGSWVCSVSRSRYTPGGRKERVAYEPSEIDVYAVVDGDLGVYLIPSGQLVGARRVSLRRFAAHRVETPWSGALRAAACCCR